MNTVIVAIVVLAMLVVVLMAITPVVAYCDFALI